MELKLIMNWTSVLLGMVILLGTVTCGGPIATEPVPADIDEGTGPIEIDAKNSTDEVQNETNIQNIKTVPVDTADRETTDIVTNEAGPKDVEIVSGLYSWGFEVSDFRPCGLDEKWWVVGSEPELSTRYNALTLETYEPVYARLAGIKSRPGQYGYLGAYDRQFEVREILELRTLQNDDCE
jgi:hypothetical protein